jgi:hypothetical protein
MSVTVTLPFEGWKSGRMEGWKFLSIVPANEQRVTEDDRVPRQM